MGAHSLCWFCHVAAHLVNADPGQQVTSVATRLDLNYLECGGRNILNYGEVRSGPEQPGHNFSFHI